MGLSDDLDKHLLIAHEASQAGRAETTQRLEHLFDELGLSWEPYVQEDVSEAWKIETDVGTVFAGLDDTAGILTISRNLYEWDGKAKRRASFLEAMLKMNGVTSGACFGILEHPEGTYVLAVGRMAALTVDKEELALSLKAVIELSKLAVSANR